MKYYSKHRGTYTRSLAIRRTRANAKYIIIILIYTCAGIRVIFIMHEYDAISDEKTSAYIDTYLKHK